MKTIHRERLTGHTAAIFEETHAMVCDGVRWCAMLLEPQNRRKTAHFFATCGRAYTCYSFCITSDLHLSGVFQL